MTASEVIAKSTICRQAARNIHPENPDELYQVVWLAIRERELANPGWQPDDPKRYFISALKKTRLMWLRDKKTLYNIDLTPETTIITDETSKDIACPAYLNEWLEEYTPDKDYLCLKNILTLVLHTETTTQAIEMCDVSRKRFYELKEEAEKRLYNDYHATNNNHDLSIDLV